MKSLEINPVFYFNMKKNQFSFKEYWDSDTGTTKVTLLPAKTKSFSIAILKI